MKKLISVFLCMAMLLSVSPALAEEQATLIVEETEILQGETMVQVKIRVENNPGITFARFNVIYDEALTLVSVADGGLWGNATHSNNYSSPYGLYWNNGTATENYTADGILATLTFKIAKETPVGTYPISITVLQGSTYNYADEDVEYETVEGSVQVVAEEISAPKAIEITNLTKSDNITFTANLTSADRGLLVVTRHGENGKYLGANIYTAAAQVPVSIANDCETVKVMWWSGFFDMHNLAPAVEFEI